MILCKHKFIICMYIVKQTLCTPVFIFSNTFSEQRSLLEKCAATALSSKLIAGQKDFFSKLVVDAVSMLDDLLPLNMIGIKKVQGGSLEVSIVIFKLIDMNVFIIIGVPISCWCCIQKDILLRWF